MYADMQDFASPEMDALEVAVEGWRLDTSASASTSRLDSWDSFTFVGASYWGFSGQAPAALQIAQQDGSLVIGDFSLLRAIVKNLAQLIRPISTALSGIVSFVMTLGCLSALGEKKLALHDVIAKSAVFEVPQSR